MNLRPYPLILLLALPCARAADSATDGTPGLAWAGFAVLVALTIAGLIFLIRRERPVDDPYPETKPIPDWSTQSADGGRYHYAINRSLSPQLISTGQLPDGTAASDLLRHAKAVFMRLRARPGKVDEISRFLAPHLQSECAQMVSDTELDFPELSIELLEVQESDQDLYVEIRFSGQVRAGEVLAPLTEHWQFHKRRGSGRWLLNRLGA
ncbi:hypothetical protein ACTSKR_05865 [Chitinibacteraceae bacterium HSL-7]